MYTDWELENTVKTMESNFIDRGCVNIVNLDEAKKFSTYLKIKGYQVEIKDSNLYFPVARSYDVIKVDR